MSFNELSSAKLLAKNLEKLRASRRPEPNETQFGKEIGLDQRRYNRLVTEDRDVRMSTLDIVCKALDLQPWQLLLPDFEPNNIPPKLPRSPEEARLYAKIEAAFRVMKDD